MLTIPGSQQRFRVRPKKRKTGFTGLFALVPKAGLEPARF
jgi:hypothetical protein